MWVLKLLLHFGFRKSEYGVVDSDERNIGETWSRTSKILFSVAIILSVVSSFYPYVSALNPNNINVGVDFRYYLQAASIIEENPVQVFTLWGGSRPLIFILIYIFQKFLGSSVLIAVRFLPVILNPLLVFASFYLSLEVFNDRKVAGLVSFFTACGYQITVNMYSHSLSNMLALSFVLLSLAFLFKALRYENNINLYVASLLSGLAMFTHPWTFNQYYAPMFFIAFYMFYYSYVNKTPYKGFKTILTFLILLVFYELIKVVLFQGVGAIIATSNVISHMVNFQEFWSNVIFTFAFLYGGTLSSITLLSLAVIGIYLLDSNNTPEVYFMFFLLLTSILFLFEDSLIMSRLLFNIPISLFAANGFIGLYRWLLMDDCKNTLCTFMFTNTVVYLFRSLANII